MVKQIAVNTTVTPVPNRTSAAIFLGLSAASAVRMSPGTLVNSVVAKETEPLLVMVSNSRALFFKLSGDIPASPGLSSQVIGNNDLYQFQPLENGIGGKSRNLGISGYDVVSQVKNGVNVVTDPVINDFLLPIRPTFTALSLITRVEFLSTVPNSGLAGYLVTIDQRSGKVMIFTYSDAATADADADNAASSLSIAIPVAELAYAFNLSDAPTGGGPVTETFLWE